MKLFVAVALALVAVACAAPAEPEPVKILRSLFDQNPEGGYKFGFESEDGISRDEDGTIKTVNDEENKPHDVVVVKGQFSYPGVDGKPVVVTYYADETGFHAESDVIPKAPAARR